MLFYVLFKACEHILVTHISGDRHRKGADLHETAERSPHSL